MLPTVRQPMGSNGVTERRAGAAVSGWPDPSQGPDPLVPPNKQALSACPLPDLAHPATRLYLAAGGYNKLPKPQELGLGNFPDIAP